MNPAEVPAAHRAGGRACSPADPERQTAQPIDIAPGVFGCIDIVAVYVN